MQINPYTGERDARLRAGRSGLVVKLTSGEAEAVQFARDRGYLPEAGVMRWRESGEATLRVGRGDAYAWRDAVEADPDAFCACLRHDLAERILGAHVILSDRWAV